jgi:hypothetical protein
MLKRISVTIQPRIAQMHIDKKLKAKGARFSYAPFALCLTKQSV